MNKIAVLVLSCLLLIQIDSLACHAPCTTCSSDLVCTACSAGSYLVEGKCIPCGYLCSACSAAGVCTNCYNGLTLVDGQCL